LDKYDKLRLKEELAKKPKEKKVVKPTPKPVTKVNKTN